MRDFVHLFVRRVEVTGRKNCNKGMLATTQVTTECCGRLAEEWRLGRLANASLAFGDLAHGGHVELELCFRCKRAKAAKVVEIARRRSVGVRSIQMHSAPIDNESVSARKMDGCVSGVDALMNKRPM